MLFLLYKILNYYFMNFENSINKIPKIPETPETTEINEELPQENERREKEENIKIFDVTIDGQQYSLRAKKNVFSYPENIEKETGIKGYERLVIDKDQIFDLLNNAWKNRFGKTLTELGVSDLDEIGNDYSPLAKLIEKDGYDFTKDSYYYKDYTFNNPEILIARFLKNITADIYRALSNNEYPDNSFLFDPSRGNNSESVIKEDKLFLQKIFGMESYNKFKDRTGKALFGNEDTYVTPEQVHFHKIDKSNHKIDKSYLKVRETSEDYKNNYNNDNYFYVADRGLNVSEKEFFFGQPTLLTKRPMIGFSLDNYLQDYILKSIDEYRKINTASDSARKEPDGKKRCYFYTGEFLKLFGMLETTVDKSYQFEPDPTNNQVDQMFYDEEHGGDVNKISHLLDKYGGRFSKDEKAENYLSIKKNEKTGQESIKVEDNWHGNEFSRHIPIFINNDDIPQLRWGAAKYCSFYNKKGFNFITMEHDDKYPGKNKSEND